MSDTELARIKAALEAKREAELAYFRYDRVDVVRLAQLLTEKMGTRASLQALLTDDTIAALVAVAERLLGQGECVCGKVWRHDSHFHAEDCPLAPLVKESDHDYA